MRRRGGATEPGCREKDSESERGSDLECLEWMSAIAVIVVSLNLLMQSFNHEPHVSSHVFVPLSPSPSLSLSTPSPLLVFLPATHLLPLLSCFCFATRDEGFAGAVYRQQARQRENEITMQVFRLNKLFSRRR